jgi:hypothetical protein
MNTKQKKQTNIWNKAQNCILYYEFYVCILQSCSTEDLINNLENDKVALYGAEVNHFSSLERNSTQEEIADIQNLKALLIKVLRIWLTLIKNFDCRYNASGWENSKTKIIFYFFGMRYFDHQLLFSRMII